MAWVYQAAGMARGWRNRTVPMGSMMVSSHCSGLSVLLCTGDRSAIHWSDTVSWLVPCVSGLKPSLLR
jgi:hypothetical protein